MKTNKHLTAYWSKHYVDPETSLCILCANTGVIALPDRYSPAGVRLTPAIAFCVCPNGQALNEKLKK